MLWEHSNALRQGGRPQDLSAVLCPQMFECLPQVLSTLPGNVDRGIHQDGRELIAAVPAGNVFTAGAA